MSGHYYSPLFGCSSVNRASDRNATDEGAIPWCSKEFFSQSRLSVQTLLHAIACINIFAHVKDPLVHIISFVDYSNTKPPSMHHRCMHRRLGGMTVTDGLSQGWESNLNFPWKNPHGTIQLQEKKKKGMPHSKVCMHFLVLARSAS